MSDVKELRIHDPAALPFQCEIDIIRQAGKWDQFSDLLADHLTSTSGIVLSALVQALGLEHIHKNVLVEISIVLTDDAHIRVLNRDFRGKDKATNVLSFPDTLLSSENLDAAGQLDDSLLMGDIVIAEETVNREATDQQKPPLHHLTHLLVHGLLHLAGYDHETTEESEQMEALEVEILKHLNIKNPYIADTA